MTRYPPRAVPPQKRPSPARSFQPPRWTWFDRICYGPNWGTRTPLITFPLAFVLSGATIANGRWLNDGTSTLDDWFVLLGLSLVLIPILWLIPRGMVRGHYRVLVRIGESGGCADCGYNAAGANAPRCPECGWPLDRSLANARWWLSRL